MSGVGNTLQESLKAADMLAAQGLSCTVADARFAKPLDADLTERLAREHEVLITIEEGSRGGFGAFVLHHLADVGKAIEFARPMVYRAGWSLTAGAPDAAEAASMAKALASDAVDLACRSCLQCHAIVIVNSGSRIATRHAAFGSPHGIFICVSASAITANDCASLPVPEVVGTAIIGNISFVALPTPR